MELVPLQAIRENGHCPNSKACFRAWNKKKHGQMHGELLRNKLHLKLGFRGSQRLIICGDAVLSMLLAIARLQQLAA